jgi:hypothetical protein
MFRRILLEDWQRTLSLVGWLLFVLVFISSAVRAFRLSRPTIDRLSNLPLDQETHE